MTGEEPPEIEEGEALDCNHDDFNVDLSYIVRVFLVYRIYFAFLNFFCQLFYDHHVSIRIWT